MQIVFIFIFNQAKFLYWKIKYYFYFNGKLISRNSYPRRFEYSLTKKTALPDCSTAVTQFVY